MQDFEHVNAKLVPRIRPVQVSELHGDLAKMLSMVPKIEGQPLQIYLTLAHHPQLLTNLIKIGSIFQDGHLEARYREFVVLRVAAISNSPYIFLDHAPLAKKEGISSAEIDALWDLRYEAKEDGYLARLIDFTDELICNDSVAYNTYSRFSNCANYQVVIEVLCLIGFYRTLCGLANAVQMKLDKFSW